MPSYLLDTNILSDLLNNPTGRVGKRIGAMSPQQRRNLYTSIVVAAEMRFGALKRNSSVLARRVEEILDWIEVLPLASGTDREYAKLRVQLERRGRPIGGNDMLIAAHALSLGCVLVTDNVREFSRVHDLDIENWLRT
ncbi:MAG TPA: type II toxin-antitoxin system VapC family toxin [Acidobacteriaceae bacterium]|nr:type II toxin-antitoxin system VapC family toxin [Acidobacteriaceae bacterium]